MGKRVNLSCVAKLSSEVKSQNSSARHVTNIAHCITITRADPEIFVSGGPSPQTNLTFFFVVVFLIPQLILQRGSFYRVSQFSMEEPI